MNLKKAWIFPSFLWVVTIIGFAISTPWQAQQEQIAVGSIVMVNTNGSNLNLRSGPGTDYAVVAKLANGTQMLVVGGPQIGNDYTWWELEGQNTKGWAAGEFLKPIQASEIKKAEVDSPSIQDSPDCQPPIYAGIQYCLRDDGKSHIVLVDLDNPHVRFESVIAQDARSVNTPEREWVIDMAERYKTDGVVAAINADYFGNGHGPEGLTIVNGKRLDGYDNRDNDNNSVNRSSLVFGKPLLDGGSNPLKVQIARLEEDRTYLNQEEYFNAVGGGPRVVSNGVWKWTRGRQKPDDSGCPINVMDNDVINGECFRDTRDWNYTTTPWTAAGITRNNQLVLIVTTPYTNVKTAFATMNVNDGIKLDGGGSSQMWFNGSPVVSGSRPVADGLLVFYKNAYSVLDQTDWKVIVSGETIEVKLSLKNTAANTWTPGNFAILSEKNPWDQSIRFELPKQIAPGDVLNWNWVSDPVDGWGVKTLEFVLTEEELQFPEEVIRVRVIVLPEKIADEKENLEQKIQVWKEQGVENLEQKIWDFLNPRIEGGWEAFKAKLYDLMIEALVNLANSIEQQCFGVYLVFAGMGVGVTLLKRKKKP